MNTWKIPGTQWTDRTSHLQVSPLQRTAQPKFRTHRSAAVIWRSSPDRIHRIPARRNQTVHTLLICGPFDSLRAHGAPPARDCSQMSHSVRREDGMDGPDHSRDTALHRLALKQKRIHRPRDLRTEAEAQEQHLRQLAKTGATAQRHSQDWTTVPRPHPIPDPDRDEDPRGTSLWYGRERRHGQTAYCSHSTSCTAAVERKTGKAS